LLPVSTAASLTKILLDREVSVGRPGRSQPRRKLLEPRREGSVGRSVLEDRLEKDPLKQKGDPLH